MLTAVRSRPAPSMPRGLEDLGRDALDGGHEQHHVEADETPQDHEDRRPDGGAHVAQPGEGREAVEAEPGEDAVQDPVARVVDPTPHDADDDGGDHVGEEGDDAVELRAAQPAGLAAAAAPDRQQRGQRQGQHDRHERQHDHQHDVVAQGPEEDRVGEHPAVVAQPDEVLGGGEPAPVGEGVVHRLQERRDDEHHVDGQREAQEDQHEADPVEGQPTPAPPGRGGGAPARPQRCDDRGHFTSIFLTESSSRTLSVISCSPWVSLATSDLPSRKLFQTTSWSVFRP